MYRLPVLLCLLLAFNAHAQQAVIKGKVFDTTSRKGLAYATVSLVRAKDSTLVTFSKADSSGNFSLKAIPFGEYLLSTSYVGFVPVWKPVHVAETLVQLGNVEMTDVKFADEVVVKAKRPPVTINGDTLEFNTENYRTAPNAVVEDMLKKMPGVTVDNDGTIRINGQKVNRVLVNGKEFFTGDPKIATRNLSADAVDKVQVFDKKSDQSEFTGVDDGNTQKAINLKLKKDRNNSLFGRVTAGGGTNARYDAQANINRFKGNQQLSFLGMGNNTNRQGFSVTDILNFTGEMARGMRGGGGMVIRTGGNGDDNGLPVTGLGQNQQGVAQTIAGGVNYNDDWSKNTNVNTSFVATDIDLDTKRKLNRQYLLPGNNYNYDQQSNSTKRVQQQKANFALEQKLDSLTSLKITPQLSFQKNHNFSLSNYSSVTDANIKLNEGYSQNETTSDASNIATNILFKKKFAKKGRTLAVNADLQYNHSDQRGSQESFYSTYSGSVKTDSTINQRNTIDAITRNYGATITYTEPVNKRSLIEMNVMANRNLGESERNTWNYNSASGKHDVLNNALSNSFRSNYVYRGGGLHYRTNQPKYNVTVGASYQDASLKGINKTAGSSVEQRFRDVLPDASFQWKFNAYSNLNLAYNTNTQQPGVRQLQPVADVSDPLNITLGNPELRRSYNHSLTLNYFSADPLRGKNLFAFAAVNFTNDAIIYSEQIQPGGVRVSKPVNTNGVMNAFSSINKGFPVKALKSRFELSLGYNYFRNISMLNQQSNTIVNSSVGPALRWNFGIDNKIDIAAGARWNFSKIGYSLQPQLNSHYLQQVYNVDMTNYLPYGFVLSNTLNYTRNTGRADGFNINVPLWNASLAKSFLKNKRAEVKLSVSDILNQNIGVNRSANQNYIEDLQYNVLKRYSMLSFTYALNKGGLNTGPRAVIRTFNN